MAQSLVNGNNINAEFPLAGQNNASQGFRDNFAAVKSGLNRAGTELTELRDRVLLKSAIPGTGLDNDLNYQALVRPQLKSYSEAVYDNGTVTTEFTMDFNRGNFQKITMSATCLFRFINFPTGANTGTVRLWVTVVNTDHRIQLPVEVAYGITAQYIANGQIQFPTAGNYLLDFVGIGSSAVFWVIPVSGLAEFTTGTTGGSGTTVVNVNTLPYASVSSPGVVKVDGITIAINNGTISVVGTLLASDQRLKDHIEPLINPLAINRALQGVSFTYRANQRASIGVLAQDVERVLPELVETDTEGYKSVNYSGLAGLFVECVKTLENEIAALRQEIQQLRGTNS